MGKDRMFSLYDVEQFIREAGAERVNEKAVVSLAQELEETVAQLVGEAQMYATYAGRNRLINGADISLATRSKGRKNALAVAIAKRRAASSKTAKGVAKTAGKRVAVANFDRRSGMLY